MYAGIELWGLAPLVWAMTGLIATRLLGRPRRVTARSAPARDHLRRAA